MSIGRTTVVAGVVAAFVAAGVNLARHEPAGASPMHETGPFRLFTQSEAGRYEAGHDPVAQSGKPTAAVYCFPQHPTAFVAGRQVQLEVATNQVSMVVRGADWRVQLQPAATDLGMDIKAACTAIRREADASDAVNRMAQKLVL